MEVEKKVRWGCHVSSSENLTEVVENVHRSGFKCFQIFFGNKLSRERRKLKDADKISSKKLLREHDISFNSHFPYWMNLCKRDCDINVLQIEMNRVAELGGRVVVHTGSCTHSSIENRSLPKLDKVKLAVWDGAWREGADILIDHLNSLEYPARPDWSGDYTLLLEPPAGEGKKLGWKLEQIKYIFDRCPKEVGFCLDTCHAFAAGCSRFNSMEVVDKFFEDLGEALGGGFSENLTEDQKKTRIAGLHRLKLIHLNDSKDTFGALKDNHASLALGNIWSEEKNLEGLMMLWTIASKNEVDIVSEVGAEQDVLMMKLMEKHYT